MTKKRKPTAKWFCMWCGQDKDKPVVGRDRRNRRIPICPHCRGPV